MGKQPSDRKPLQRGFQSEIVLLLAEYQQASRANLSESFSGDDRQFKNALRNLRSAGLIGLQAGIYELTEAGFDQAKMLSKLPQKSSIDRPVEEPKTVKPVIHLVKPKDTPLSKKIAFLQDLKRLLSQDLSELVVSIEGDLMALHGEQK